jgi:hypothetical protein
MHVQAAAHSSLPGTLHLLVAALLLSAVFALCSLSGSSVLNLTGISTLSWRSYLDMTAEVTEIRVPSCSPRYYFGLLPETEALNVQDTLQISSAQIYLGLQT